jgi:hypothetical protein
MTSWTNIRLDDATQWAQQLVDFKAQNSTCSQFLAPAGPWTLDTKEQNVIILLELIQSSKTKESLTREILDVLRILSREMTGSQMLFRPDVPPFFTDCLNVYVLKYR